MKEVFIEAIREERQGVLAAVDGVDEVTLATVPVCGTWTAKEVLSHLAAVDGVALHVLRQARAGEDLTWPWDNFDGDDWNGAEVTKRQNLSIGEILADLRENHQQILAEFESWPAESGPFGPDSWDAEKCPIGWLPSHDREHADALGALRKVAARG